MHVFVAGGSADVSTLRKVVNDLKSRNGQTEKISREISSKLGKLTFLNLFIYLLNYFQIYYSRYIFFLVYLFFWQL
jgi:hypothetical protein